MLRNVLIHGEEELCKLRITNYELRIVKSSCPPSWWTVGDWTCGIRNVKFIFQNYLKAASEHPEQRFPLWHDIAKHGIVLWGEEEIE